MYEIKRRVDNKAMLLLVDSPDRIVRSVAKIPAVAWDRIELTTKPRTIIYDGARNLAPNLIAEDGSVGIRVTSELFSKELCYRFQRAVVATSANISGEPTPENFSEIDKEIIDAVDYVVGYKQLDMGKAKSSSIIKLTANGTVTVIRE